jgi:hypothetical protein
MELHANKRGHFHRLLRSEWNLFMISWPIGLSTALCLVTLGKRWLEEAVSFLLTGRVIFGRLSHVLSVYFGTFYSTT